MKITNKFLIEKAFVNGSWEKGADTFEVRNPATGETIAQLPNLSVEEATRAIAAAEQALPAWKFTTATARSEILMKWYFLIKEHTDALAELMTLECGKPITESYGEIQYGNSFVEWFAEEGKRAYGESIPAPNPQNRIITSKQAVGVTAANTPSNFPLATITRKVQP